MRIQEKKLKILRESYKVTQVNLADAIFADASKISKAEAGLTQYTDIQIDNALKHLGMPGMPLSETDCAVKYKELYMFHDNIRDKRFDEARKQHEDMATIVRLDPCDENLPMLYRLFEVALFIYGQESLDAAEKKLEYFHNILDKITNEHRYHYYFHMGVILTRRGRYKESLECYLQALELSKGLNILEFVDIKRIHLGIASCYSLLEFPYRAISYAQSVYSYAQHNNRKVSVYDLHFDNMLALNYIKVNELDKAEKILKNTIICARSINDNQYIGMTLTNFGRLHKQNENWCIALDYFGQTMECFEKSSTNYLRALHEVIFCMAGMRKYTKAQQLLDKTEYMYHDHEIFHVPFKALRDYITIRSRLSLFHQPVEYIETIAIPHFKKTHDYFLAKDYNKLLASYYENKNNKKTLTATEAICQIYERCLLNNEGSGK